MCYSDIRARARQMLSGKWGMAILTTFVAAVLGGLVMSGGVSINFNQEKDSEVLQRLPNVVKSYFAIAASVGGILGLAQFILGGVVRLGYCKYLLKLHDGEDADIKDLFSEFDRFADGFVLSLLQSIYIFLWTLLFIIPGIVATYKYAMAPFILLENPGMRPNDAITKSKQMMDGRKLDLFCLVWSFFGWILLSVLTLGIGELWLNPYMNASYAAFYREISYTAPQNPTTPAFDPQEPKNPW